MGNARRVKKPADINEAHTPTTEQTEWEKFKYSHTKELDVMFANPAWKYIESTMLSAHANAVAKITKNITEQETNVTRGKMQVYRSFFEMIQYFKDNSLDNKMK